MSGKSETSFARGLTGAVARKAIVSLAASAAAAASAYVVNKLPSLVEEKVLPKLRDPGRARDAAERLTKKAEQVMKDAAGRVDLSHAGSRLARVRSNPTRGRASLAAVLSPSDGGAAARKQRDARRRARRRAFEKTSS